MVLAPRRGLKLATARRGAWVSSGALKRDRASLGANFLEVDLGGIKTEDAGGYAVELSDEAMDRGRDLIAEHAKVADVVITTAQVPGRPAPLLVTEAAVDGMKRGSIVIDLAASTGGNCAVSRPDETVERDGVTIVAPTNLAATVQFTLFTLETSRRSWPTYHDGELNFDNDRRRCGPRV